MEGQGPGAHGENHQERHPVPQLRAGRRGRDLAGAAARRIAVDGFRALVGTTSLAAFGTNMIVRTASFLVLNAARLLSGLDIPSSFVDTEPEARAFLAAQRARLQAERSRRQARSGS